jgi:hypothetical protein
MYHNRTLAALALCGVAVLAGCGALDEPIYQASVKLEKEWDVGSSPEVVADLFSGSIYVTPGREGRVTASLRIGRASKISQDVADKAVKNAPGVAMTQEGNCISIIELKGNAASCSLHLSVPAGIRLNLHAGAGDICVGYNPVGGAPAAVTVAGLKAKQDSVGVLSVNILGTPSQPPRLDLEGDNLKLTVNGLPVDVGPPTKDNGPGNGQHWHFISK